jgi:hypothetical protein
MTHYIVATVEPEERLWRYVFATARGYPADDAARVAGYTYPPYRQLRGRRASVERPPVGRRHFDARIVNDVESLSANEEIVQRRATRDEIVSAFLHRFHASGRDASAPSTFVDADLEWEAKR